MKNQTAAKQPKIRMIARLYLNDRNTKSYVSGLAEIGVNFSFIYDGENRTDGTPSFVVGSLLPKWQQVALSNVKLVGDITKEYPNLNSVELKSDWGDLTLSKAEMFVKLGKHIQRKMQLIGDTDLDSSNLRGCTTARYIVKMLTVLGCNSILFESFSEKSGLNRWNEYSLNDMEFLLKTAQDMLREMKGW